MRFSVIIPLYNKRAYIENTIKSVLNQNYEDFEIIVIDDGSTDEGHALVSSFKKENIRLLRQINQGVSAARNNGIKVANGDYVCFLDADDEWTPDFLKTINFLIKQYSEADMFCTSYQIRYKNKIIIPQFKGIDKKLKHGLIENYICSSTGRYSLFNSSCVAINRVRVLEAGLFSEEDRVGEDLDMWLRIAEKNKIAFSRNICSIYNRTTTDNARTRNSIHYPKAYLNTLMNAYNSNNYSAEDKSCIKKIYDRKITAYIFSLIYSGYKVEASESILAWKPKGIYMLYKLGLMIALACPIRLIKMINDVRMRR